MEERIKALEIRVDSLTKSLLQLQKNQTPITEKAESAENGVKAITPTTLTKTAYIDDTEVIFTDMPEGNVAVYFDKPYRVERVGSDIKVSFEPLEEVTIITISIL